MSKALGRRPSPSPPGARAARWLALGLLAGLALPPLPAHGAPGAAAQPPPAAQAPLRAPLRQVLEAFAAYPLERAYLLAPAAALEGSWAALDALAVRGAAVRVWLERCPASPPPRLQVFALGSAPRGVLLLGWGPRGALLISGDAREVQGAALPAASGPVLLRQLGLEPLAQAGGARCP